MRLALALIATVIVAACSPKKEICSRCLCEAGACDRRPSRTDAGGAWIYPDQTWPPSSQDPRDPGIFSRDWRYPNFYDGPREPAPRGPLGPTGTPKSKARPPPEPGDPWL